MPTSDVCRPSAELDPGDWAAGYAAAFASPRDATGGHRCDWDIDTHRSMVAPLGGAVRRDACGTPPRSAHA